MAITTHLSELSRGSFFNEGTTGVVAVALFVFTGLFLQEMRSLHNAKLQMHFKPNLYKKNQCMFHQLSNWK